MDDNVLPLVLGSRRVATGISLSHCSLDIANPFALVATSSYGQALNQKQYKTNLPLGKSHQADRKAPEFLEAWTHAFIVELLYHS